MEIKCYIDYEYFYFFIIQIIKLTFRIKWIQVYRMINSPASAISRTSVDSRPGKLICSLRYRSLLAMPSGISRYPRRRERRAIRNRDQPTTQIWNKSILVKNHPRIIIWRQVMTVKVKTAGRLCWMLEIVDKSRMPTVAVIGNHRRPERKTSS